METIEKTANIKWVQISLGLMFVLILLPSNIKAISILIFGLSVASFSLRRKFVFDWKFFLINSIIYGVIAMTFFYSENKNSGTEKLQQMSSLIVFPFIFALTTSTERKALFKYLYVYMWIYIIGVFLFNAVTFIWFFTTKYNFQEMMIHFETVLHVKLGKYNIHGIYLSMHCGIALLFSLYLFKELKQKKTIFILILVDVFLVLFLLLFAKKGPLLALLIVLTLFVLFQQKKGYVKPYILVTVTLIALIIAIPKTRNKFIELLKIERLDKGIVNSTNIRYSIYTTTSQLIKEKPLVGYGIGDYKDVLVERYAKNGNETLVAGRYNAHNQYFSFVLMGGVGLLLLFFLSIGLNLVFAIRYNNQILILILLFYGLVMFTENILEREQGVIFFSFFLSFFGLHSKQLALR